MKSPKTPEQLGAAIEALVSFYVSAGREAAAGALDRAFATSASRYLTKVRCGEPDTPLATKQRRSMHDLAGLSERLYALVLAHPGESMSLFAREIGTPAKALHLPMSKLKAAGRVRSVGQRSLTRYFPATGRRSKSAES